MPPSGLNVGVATFSLGAAETKNTLRVATIRRIVKIDDRASAGRLANNLIEPV